MSVSTACPAPSRHGVRAPRVLAPVFAALAAWVALTAAPPAARAQLDTRHWIPTLWSGLQATSAVGKHWLIITTPEAGTVNVTVTDGAGATVYAGTVTNAAPRVIELGHMSGQTYVSSTAGSSNIVFGDPALAQKHPAGLVVVADKPVYANIRNKSSDQGTSLTAKGRKALGVRFRAGVMRDKLDVGKSYRGVFVSVMATQPDTTITFGDIKPGMIFTHTTTGGTPATTQPFSVTLAQNESYVIGFRHPTYAGTADVNDVNGTLITSDKPIAVVSGGWLSGEGKDTGQDIGIDQIAPEALAGTEYVLMKGNAPNSDPKETPMVIATRDDTTVWVNGDPTPLATLDAGDYLWIHGKYTADHNLYVVADEPVLMFQTIGGSASTATPGFNFIPPLGAGSDTFVDNIYDVDQLGAATLAIVAHAGATVTVNGAPIGVAAKPVAGTDAWVTYRKTGLNANVSVHSDETVAVAIFNVSNNIGAAGYFSGFPPALVDLDFDGVVDGHDNCPDVSNPGQLDGDEDGAGDACDPCLGDPYKVDPGDCGCGFVDEDTDGNGVSDCLQEDTCPDDPLKIGPGVCGCGVPDADGDGDHAPDCVDACPEDPAKTDPGICGCGAPDVDSDFDATSDCLDYCPHDRDKTEPGRCGCGNAEDDGDEDSVPDCVDDCPDGVLPDELTLDGGLLDTDEDLVPDGCDNCLGVGNPAQADCDGDGIGDACDALGECCDDDVQDLDETDVDCGGSCPPCVDGAGCLDGDDCDSGICPVPPLMCLACVDTGAGAEVDLGCDEPSSECDDATLPNACVVCEDDAAPGAVDGGCSAQAPACDVGGEAPVCVGCLADADCGSDVCDTGARTCAGCLDTTAGPGPDAGCAEAAPECATEGTSNLCVPCQDDAEPGAIDGGCVADAPACDITGGAPVCVPCLVDPDCPGGLVCDVAAHACVACNTDLDCGEGAVCHVAAHVCVSCLDTRAGAGVDHGCAEPLSECDDTGESEVCTVCEDDAEPGAVDGGCDAATPACDVGGAAPVCVECLVDADCAAGLCDGDTHRCEPCLDTTAGPGPDAGCDAEAPECAAEGEPNGCVRCQNDAAAGAIDGGCDAAAPACDESGAAPVCVACLEDADCPSGACDPASRTCVACVDDADCPEGVCDPSTHACVACLDDADCPAGACDPALHLCVGCLDDADCAVGVCDLAVHACVECLDDADCPDGVCDVAAHACVGCLEDADCPAGVCNTTAQACAQCNVDADCVGIGEVCDDHVCAYTDAGIFAQGGGGCQGAGGAPASLLSLLALLALTWRRRRA